MEQVCKVRISPCSHQIPFETRQNPSDSEGISANPVIFQFRHNSTESDRIPMTPTEIRRTPTESDAIVRMICKLIMTVGILNFNLISSRNFTFQDSDDIPIGMIAADEN
jgi:hypothetical protein